MSREAGKLALSVVIATHDALQVVEACLDALVMQSGAVNFEIIVADSSIDGTDQLIRARFPGVTLLHFDEPLTVPQLRGRAIAACRGPIIAVIDPFSIVAPDWTEAVVHAHALGDHPVVGGSVEMSALAKRSLSSWALYFNEYGLFMPPVRAGITDLVPGSNVSYKRHVLFDGEQARYPVFWKTFVNWQARDRSGSMWLDPAIRVELFKPIPFTDFLRSRFEHGRCFAAMRVAGSGRLNRVFRVVTAPLVPAVLFARWTRGIWAKRRRRETYLLTIPLQVLLFVFWGLGEMVGYAAGEGCACQRLHY